VIVSTKFQIPHIRNTMVSRPKLMRKLNEGMATKLMLVSAQAGYGKTTALSEWVKQCGAVVAWVSLDKHDNEWISFWSGVTSSIQARIPGFGQTIGYLLEKGPSESSEPMIKELLNELNHITGKLVIILDDYHVIELPDIHQSLGYLLEYLPPHIHLYIASRTDLPIPTARLLAKNEMLYIQMQDLRFELEEGFEFFRDTTDLSLTKGQVTELFRQTEGWISGLQLAAISLKRSTNIKQSIQQFSGQQHHISDYLLEEVFLHQPETMRSFLLETSILSRMNHSLCLAVTGQKNSQEQLERLEQLNLFIIPLDEERNWYRYHHLLSDFLRQLGSRTESDKWMQAHVRAAKWLEKHGFDEEAVEHYLEGQQYMDVIRLIEKNPPALMQSKSAALMKWITVLPESSFAEKPMIEMFYIAVMLLGGKREAAIQRMMQTKVRFEALQGKLPDVDWNMVMGNIYFYCGMAAYIQNDFARASDYLALTERYMPEGSYFQVMGVNRYEGYSRNYDQLTLIKDLYGAEDFILKWIKVWEHKKNYPFIGYFYLAYIHLMYEWNRLEEAEFYFGQSLERIYHQPLARLTIQLDIAASRIEQAKGNPKRAFERLAQLKSKIDTPDHDLFVVKIETEQAYLSLRQGSLQDALDWVQRCGLAHTDEVSLHLLAEYLILARVLAACERIEEALYLLERLYLLVCKGDCLRDRAKVLIAQSVTLWRSGQTEAALIPLGTALDLAKPDGYIRSFIDEGFVMAELLNAYSKVRPDSHSSSDSYVKQLLRAMNDTPEADPSPKGILTGQEYTILLLIGDRLMNKEIAEHLNITVDTVKFHIKNIYRKLEVNNRKQALQLAKQL
jgi:LuxR family maltose regulon positive regulatory protein